MKCKIDSGAKIWRRALRVLYWALFVVALLGAMFGGVALADDLIGPPPVWLLGAVLCASAAVAGYLFLHWLLCEGCDHDWTITEKSKAKCTKCGEAGEVI